MGVNDEDDSKQFRLLIHVHLQNFKGHIVFHHLSWCAVNSPREKIIGLRSKRIFLFRKWTIQLLVSAETQICWFHKSTMFFKDETTGAFCGHTGHLWQSGFFTEAWLFVVYLAFLCCFNVWKISILINIQKCLVIKKQINAYFPLFLFCFFAL